MRIVLTVLLVLIIPVAAQATTYYVDNSGTCSDTNVGTSQSAPWCTVAKAMRALPSKVAGDQILFKCGDTWNESMSIPAGTHGASGNPIIIGHYGSNCVLPSFSSYDGTNSSHSYARTLPILNGGSSLSNGIIAQNVSVSYLTIDGFDVQNFTLGGINFATPSCGGMPGITIQNNAVHETGAGAFPGATQGPASGNEFCTNSPPGGPGPCDPSRYDIDAGISFNDDMCSSPPWGQDGSREIGNFVWDIGGHNTIRVHYDGSPNTLVQGNVAGPGCIHSCFDDKGINATIQNNIATCPEDTARGGTWGQCARSIEGFYTENPVPWVETPTYRYNLAFNVGACFQINGNTIAPTLVNNTCDNARDYHSFSLENGTVAPCTVEKNIIGGPMSAQGGGACTWDCNNKFGSSGERGAGSGTHDVNVNPGYVNKTTPPQDYHTTNSTNNTGGSACTITNSPFIGALGSPTTRLLPHQPLPQPRRQQHSASRPGETAVVAAERS